jgi:hypothetical protein
MPLIPFPGSIPCLLLEGLAVTVVNALTGTGQGIAWGVSAPADKLSRSVDYQCFGTFSAASIQIQESMDGGTTWANSGNVINVVTFPAGNFAPIITGPLYRIAVTAFTGTSITVNLMVS